MKFKTKTIFLVAIMLLSIMLSNSLVFAEDNNWSGNGVKYEVGDIVRFQDNSYQCTIAHDSQSTWKPNVAVSLWKLYAPTTVSVTEPSEVLINGIPESQLNNLPMPGAVTLGPPKFISLKLVSNQRVQYYKECARTYVDNRRNKDPFPLTLSITNSSSTGGEISTDVSMNAEFQAGFLGKLGVTVGFGVKLMRETNEAVGASGTFNVPGGKQGDLIAYYGGYRCGTDVTYKRYNPADRSADPYIYYTTKVTATVFKNTKDVSFLPIAY